MNCCAKYAKLSDIQVWREVKYIIFSGWCELSQNLKFILTERVVKRPPEALVSMMLRYNSGKVSWVLLATTWRLLDAEKHTCFCFWILFAHCESTFICEHVIQPPQVLLGFFFWLVCLCDCERAVCATLTTARFNLAFAFFHGGVKQLAFITGAVEKGC